MQKLIVVLLGILVVLVGILTGQALQANHAPQPEKDSRLLPGDPFPSVELATAEGTMVTTDDLVRDGRVVLFMDPACPGCGDMTGRWQEAIDTGRIPADRVMGVTLSAADTEAYRVEHGLTFPIYQDLSREFAETWEVRWIPAEVRVGASGTMRTVRGNEDDMDWSRILRDLES